MEVFKHSGQAFFRNPEIILSSALDVHTNVARFSTGKSRIRVQISASHSQEEIAHCVNAFVEVGKKKGVIN